ncbi:MULTISPECIES: lysophospholipid acyltransferase family protein [unclassified Mesorhizobium]|uniref:lysophospholipid acyltransferase family protein n=1 Tax=unclassified Mesorhizobium TaxID=325217 RepID=UPI002414DCB6|nr:MULTISPECIES: lysophospholipid acyltransferase family protein [unclassified Mesorhizobium]MDG4854436.1 lysophospholipid acyltransferase family protein [Mesorhizobium sp. WSM4982]MDG4914303.1 lysophospholipid acyltransferase family protein [Mesorhizobium sp. WSM4983]
MEHEAVKGATGRAAGRGGTRTLWRRIREPLAQSRFVKNFIASLFAWFVRLIRITSPLVKGSTQVAGGAYAHLEPGIIALWHGQHLLTPAYYPKGRPLVAMVSRSADAELNALMLNRFGIDAVRGSGGRDSSRHLDKGGAKALIALKKALVAGKNVAMIADIPHGTPRDAGLGIVLLARLSGRPILPSAIATSRRKVLEKSWDKTTINLPFGRSAVIVGQPVFVPFNADDAEMERKRQEVTASLNAATAEAYRLVDGDK